MKFSSIISLFALQALTASAVPTGDILESPDVSSPENPLRARACWYGAMSGWGSNGRCWKRCGGNIDNGHWCWLAADRGRGAWATCAGSQTQCTNDCRSKAGLTNRYDCGVGNCSECGCSC